MENNIFYQNTFRSLFVLNFSSSFRRSRAWTPGQSQNDFRVDGRRREQVSIPFTDISFFSVRFHFPLSVDISTVHLKNRKRNADIVRSIKRADTRCNALKNCEKKKKEKKRSRITR